MINNRFNVVYHLLYECKLKFENMSNIGRIIKDGYCNGFFGRDYDFQENLNISDVSEGSFDDILKEYGRDEIIRVIYLWTSFRRSSGDLEKMTNDELKFHWEQVVKNYYH